MSAPPIRVVFGMPSLTIGGIEKHFSRQLPHFNRERFEIHLVTLFDTRYKLDRFPNLYKEVSPFVTVHKLDFGGPFDLKSWIGLWKLLRRIRPHIVITSMFSANAAFRLLKPVTGYESIAREHNTYADRTFLHHMLDRLLSFFTFKVVAVSNGVKDYIRANTGIPESSIQVIYNGVDIDGIEAFKAANAADRAAIKKDLGFAESDRVVLNVARLKAQKNQKLLIEAFERFLADHPGHVLAIVGRGNEDVNLEKQIADRGLRGKVRLLGHRDDVYRFYMVSDFFVLSSDIEGFAIVAVEAMAFGIPVVSTRVAGPVEYVVDGENGFLTDSTPEAMAQKMSALAALLVTNRAAVEEKCMATAKTFSMQRNVAQYERLFESAAGSAHKP